MYFNLYAYIYKYKIYLYAYILFHNLNRNISQVLDIYIQNKLR